MKREWEISPIFLQLAHTNEYVTLVGVRNDGMQFQLRVPYSPLEDQKLIAVSALEIFDTFLDPACNCVVGKNCKMHEKLDRGASHES